MADDDARAHRPVWRSHRRPAVDSRRSGARAMAVALRLNDCARLLDTFTSEPFHEAVHSIYGRRPDGRELQIASRPLPLSLSPPLHDPSPHPAPPPLPHPPRPPL